MRILILSQWYMPEPARLLQELAQTLTQKGHEVSVLTGFPNYPSGKIYSGYKQSLFQREVLDGIPVVRVPLFPEHSRSGLLRALNYISFALSASLLGPLLLSRPDVIFVYHPPLTVGMPAYVLSRIWQVPFLFQIQDMWPEHLSATGMLNNRRMLDWLGWFAKWIYARADAISVISPGFRDNLIAKGVPPEKIHLIVNWVDLDTYHPNMPEPQLAEELGLADKFNIMFAGNIGKSQGLETVLDAAEVLKDLSEVQFVLVGDGVALPQLRKDAEVRELDNIRFLGRYPTEAMSGLYALADVLLVNLKNDPLFRMWIPHKVFAYMASGKPILAAVAGDTADVVADVGAGIVCPPQDSEAMASAVRRFVKMPETERQLMSKRGLTAVHQKYSRENLVGEIESLLRSLVTRQRSAEG
jgi:colanic acid biosynthesis glycosyl transferase WcaI